MSSCQRGVVWYFGFLHSKGTTVHQYTLYIQYTHNAYSYSMFVMALDCAYIEFIPYQIDFIAIVQRG